MESKGFALLGMIVAAPLIMALAMLIAVLLGPLIGYAVGWIFGWLWPESWASAAWWLGFGNGMTAAKFGAFLGFVSAFLRPAANVGGNKK